MSEFNIFFADTTKPVTKPKKAGTTPAEGKQSIVNDLKPDTVPVPATAIFTPTDSLPTVKDTVIVDTLNMPKMSADSLDARVTFKATDSIVLRFKEKRFYLYNNADVKYKDIHLTAARMNFSQETGILEAMNVTDSTGKKQGRPILNSGDQETESDTIRYSFISQKAKIFHTKAVYGEGFVHSEQIKKSPDNTIFGFRNGYTTCNLDTPHFAFRARKIKVIPDKIIVSGPANLEIEGIPTPLFIPFAIFPITQGQRSGILPPQYTVNQQKGIGLENGGYYLGLGEHLDLTMRGAIYSYGSWGLTLSPTYRKRYKYNGGFNIAVATTRIGDKEVKQDFSNSRDFRVTWNHSMDSKARPGTNFSANVNFGTSTYNTYNTYDYATRLNNMMSSSIAYSKSWAGKPYNLTVSMNHSQNTSTRDVVITLPEASFTVNTLYPFQKNGVSGTPKWFEKIGVAYNLNARNTASFKDSLFGKEGMLKNMQTGIQHQIPISFSIPITKNITMSPSVNYGERWYTKRIVRTYDSLNNKIDTAYQGGFYRLQEMSVGVSLATAVYGMYSFGKNSKVTKIRHVMRPTVGMNYSPDFGSKYYYNLRIDTGNTARAFQRVSYFDGSVYGTPAAQAFGGISFGLDNNLEMKVKSKKDSTGERKVKLLDGFGFNGSYNLVVDSFKLSTINFYARTNLFDKVNISATANVDPYQYDSLGRRTPTYAWKGGKGFNIGRLTDVTVSMSTSFQSGDKKSKQKEQQKQDIETEQTSDAQMQAQQRQLEMVRRNPGEYVDFDIPWRLDLSYSLNMSKSRTSDYRRDTTIFNQYLSFNGDFSLTPKWKVGLNSGFDFINKRIAYTTMYISRDMHCWQMSINLVPFGSFRQFSITINPKAGILRDLRINRTRQFQDL
ncbi:putative LPS assembly protein LptD [Chitinophaga skermanii]|uniref:putative LPS assembly protein LptD n=1 Tax=Chitinophaga skermanii TaxID=331697 RepID=UPI0011E5D364|nr:putative LPS assembly protein LptD [Chitinophaga skermanii]